MPTTLPTATGSARREAYAATFDAIHLDVTFTVDELTVSPAKPHVDGSEKAACPCARHPSSDLHLSISKPPFMPGRLKASRKDTEGDRRR
jgi:hypothetical protein